MNLPGSWAFRRITFILTGNSRPGTDKNKRISHALAKLIAIEFGYDENRIMND